MSYPSLSIVIITLNEEKHLPNLLHDLISQTWRDFEIIHVDSSSEDYTVAISREFSGRFDQYHLIEMDTRGVSLGRNVGARAAKGKRLLFLDADTRLQPDFLEKTVPELDQRGLQAGIVCMSAAGLGLHHRVGYELMNLGIYATSVFFPTAVGACLFSTLDLHQKIGGFDERLSLCEDCNYVLKAHRIDPHFVGVLETRFGFDPRRLDQDGLLRTGQLYLRANLRRFFRGELYGNEIAYAFGHYE